jgi:hypothetical protein
MDERKKGEETRGTAKPVLCETPRKAEQMFFHGSRDPEKHEGKQGFSAFGDVD